MIGGSQLVYQLHVTPQLIGLGVCVALVVGQIGGLFPSIRAARIEIASGLRSL
jgi:putative ABC transport system permease protein